MSNPAVESRAKTSILRPVLIAVLVQVAFTYVTAGSRLTSGLDDTDIYHRYATRMREGKVPYRDFRVEYPPLALPMFVVPALVARDVSAFKVFFAIEMLLFNAATVWAVAAWVERNHGRDRVPARLAWYTIYYVLLSRLVVSRFDAAPMLLGFAAATRWYSGRGARGGVAAALGTLMKVYPAVIALVATPWDLTRPGRSRGRGSIAFIAVLLLGSLAWLAVGSTRGVSESMNYQMERGFEYGSLYSGVQMLAAKVAGAEIAVVRDHAAWSSVTPWSPRLLSLVLPIQAATILLVCVVFARRGMAEGVRYTAAAILAFIVTGKVFSPQYLIWLIPFVAVLDGPTARRARRLFAAGCVATLVAPGLTGYFRRTSAEVILAYNFKNALFLALLVLLTFGPDEISVRPPTK